VPIARHDQQERLGAAQDRGVALALPVLELSVVTGKGAVGDTLGGGEWSFSGNGVWGMPREEGCEE
jgi:hypothetical protein